jgi:hypothetical protein
MCSEGEGVAMVGAGAAVMMMMASSAAARRRKQQRAREKKVMARLRERAGDNYEFKTLRSAIGAFGNPQTVQRVTGEEARAGWRPARKFDNHRLVFMRNMRERALDQGRRNTGIDPYRRTYGMSETTLNFVVAVGTLVFTLAAGFVLCSGILFT